jgi:hypothetical protein
MDGWSGFLFDQLTLRKRRTHSGNTDSYFHGHSNTDAIANSLTRADGFTGSDDGATVTGSDAETFARPDTNAGALARI